MEEHTFVTVNGLRVKIKIKLYIKKICKRTQKIFLK